jgi:hypothetical protein
METILVVPDRAADFCKEFFPDLKCEWIPWNFGHNEITQSRFTEVVANSRITAVEITRIFDRFAPHLVIGLPGFYTSFVCRAFGLPHIAVLHGAWLVHEYDLPDLSKTERLVIDKCYRLYEIVDVFAKIVTHAFGQKHRRYRDWLDKEQIWVAQDFPIEYKQKRPQIGFLSGEFGPVTLPNLPESCISITLGTGNAEIRTDVILALSLSKHPLVVIAKEEPKNGGRILWAPLVQATSLARISRVAISHAGISTMAIFAKHGVPQVFLPHDIDQAVNALLASRSGFGSTIDLEHWHKQSPISRLTPPYESAQIVHLITSEIGRALPFRPKLNATNPIPLIEGLIPGH